MDNRRLQISSLVSQQFRLRDISRITCHNILSNAEPESQATYYHYTIHKNGDTNPLFSSPKCSGIPPLQSIAAAASGDDPGQPSLTVSWPDIKKDFDQDSPRQSVIIRVWQSSSLETTKATDNNNNKLLICYGIHFSGLVPYSTELLLSARPKPNALVINTRSGYSFISPESIEWTAEETLNTNPDDVLPSQPPLSTLASDLFLKYTSIECASACAHSGCTLDQLLRLQQSQLRLKYKQELLRSLIAEIQSKSGVCMEEGNTGTTTSPSTYYHHHHRHGHNSHSGGSMGKTLTRLLNMEPERVDPKTLLDAFKLRKQIEAVRGRCRLLTVERDRAKSYVTALEKKRRENCDRNVETDSTLLANYHAMSKEKEQYLHLKLTLTKDLETLQGSRGDWRVRQQTLLREICEIYDVKEHEGSQYTINGISLPDAEAYENTHVPATSISVALGYAAHLVLVISNVLAVPLRNPIVFKGSQSQIMGQLQIMNVNVFPLFCRTMPPPDETKYAIFLLNQNLTQLLVYSGKWPTDLRATLANLMNLTKNCQLVDSDSGMLHMTPYIYGAASSSDLMDQHQQAIKDETRSLDMDHRKYERGVSWAEEVVSHR